VATAAPELLDAELAEAVRPIADLILRRLILERAAQLVATLNGTTAETRQHVDEFDPELRRCPRCERTLPLAAFDGRAQCTRCRQRRREAAAAKTKPKRAGKPFGRTGGPVASNGNGGAAASEPEPEPGPSIHGPSAPSSPELEAALAGARGPRAAEIANGQRTDPARPWA
jgi:ribosomal protein S27AE